MYAYSHNAKIHHKAWSEWIGGLYWNINKLYGQILFWKDWQVYLSWNHQIPQIKAVHTVYIKLEVQKISISNNKS